jgi:ribonucleotide reductase beta subunit family protein with ferritin-like domain
MSSDLDMKLKNNFSKDVNKDETILNAENNRLTIYPIQFESIWQSYKIQQAAFWTAEEIDFSKDYYDMIKLNDNEQFFIKMILAFFAASDTIVNINLSERFQKDVKIREAIVCYNYQMMMENIHNEVYSLMINNLIRDNEEKHKLLNAIQEFPCIEKKARWATNWIESDESFAKRLLAFAIVEGIFFSGSFCAIFRLKKRGVMPGLCNSNELIARDEGLHTKFAVLLYSMLNDKIPEDQVHSIFKEAVEIEREFICDSLPCALIGMNSDSMTQYIKFVADRLLLDLNYNKIWNVTNPFDFMESISVEGKTNFFEQRPTQYQNASVLNKNKDAFTITEDF